jgi:sialidase-1
MADAAGVGFRVVVAPGSAQFPRNGESAILPLKDGRLLLSYSQFYGGAGDDSAARIVGTISEDGGRTWGPTFVMQENDAGHNVMCANLLRLANGDILFIYIRQNSYADTRTLGRLSHDEGKTWDAEIDITKDTPGYIFIENDRGIQLKSGRILSPEAYSPDYNKENHFRSVVHRSDDGGKTWQRSANMVDAPQRGAMEPDLIELKDGRVLMMFRVQMGRIWQSFSADSGVTWSEAQPSALVAPEAPSKMRRIPSTGDILIIYNHNYDPAADHGGLRRPLSAAISTDDGATWTHLKDIENDSARIYQYPSIAFAGDMVLLSYYENSSLVVRGLPVSWFYE